MTVVNVDVEEPVGGGRVLSRPGRFKIKQCKRPGIYTFDTAEGLVAEWQDGRAVHTRRDLQPQLRWMRTLQVGWGGWRAQREGWWWFPDVWKEASK